MNFTKNGVRYPFSETRWQIAEFIRLKKDVVLDDYLRVLLEDQDQYVQRRALLAMAERTPSSAAECAWKRITDDDFMMRLVSLRILDELSSSRLIEALELLSGDPPPLVRQEVESITGNGYAARRFRC